MKLAAFTALVHQDVKVAFRSLAARSGVSVAAALIIAVGIGAVATLAGTARAILLSPLPFREPETLVRIWEANPEARIDRSPMSVPAYLDLSHGDEGFSQVGAAEMATFNMTSGGTPERLAAARITATLLPTLGVTPVIGRGFTTGDEQPGASKVVLISYAVWRKLFPDGTEGLTTPVTLNGAEYSVVGVMPPGFDFPGGRDVWVPLTIDPATEPWRADRGNRNLVAIARLAPGASRAEALSRLDVVASRLEQQFPSSNRGWSFQLQPISEWIVPTPVRTGTRLVVAVGALLLLLACGNVAALSLSRVVSRRSELATQLALGATRGRLVSQVLVEGATIALAGGLAGIVLAVVATAALRATDPPGVLGGTAIGIGTQVLLLSAALIGVVALLASSVPAAWLSGSVRRLTPSGETRTMSMGRGTGRLFGSLIAFQCCVTAGVVAVGGLLLHSFVQITSTSTGFRPDHLLAFNLNLSGQQYDRQKTVQFYRELLSRLASQPDVLSAGATSHPPFVVGEWRVQPSLESAGTIPGAAVAHASTAGYFAAAGMTFEEGRTFRSDELRPGTELPVVVSHTLARQLWPGVTAVDRRLRPDAGAPMARVVGVVSDVPARLGEAPEATIYLPYEYAAMPSLSILVRTASAPLNVVPEVRDVVRSLDPLLPIYNVRTGADILSAASAQPRFQAVLVVTIALAALILAAFGSYSIVAYTMLQRRKELAIRFALGASTFALTRQALQAPLAFAFAGTLLGIGCAAAAARLLASLLFGIAPVDPLTFTAAPLLLLAATSGASYTAARLAYLGTSRTSPLRS